MLSFQSIYTQAQDLVQDYSSEALVFLKRNINIGQKILETELGSFYTEETITRATTASNGVYYMPADCIRLVAAYVTVGTTQYNLEVVYDEDYWQVLKSSTIGSYNDAATHVIARRDTFEIWPGAATAGNTITLRYEAGGQDLQYDDYTAGTILTLTTATDDVVGVGTTFTAAMEGRYIKIDADGVWYKISDVLTATTLTLDRNYQGASIAAGTDTYIIGQLPRTPGQTHHIPAYYAAMNYYNGYKQNETRGSYFRTLYNADMKAAIETYSKRYASKYMIGGYKQRGRHIINPNYPPQNMS